MKKGNVKKKSACSDKMMVLMIICVLLSLATLAIVAYDKFIKPTDTKPVATDSSWQDSWED